MKEMAESGDLGEMLKKTKVNKEESPNDRLSFLYFLVTLQLY